MSQITLAEARQEFRGLLVEKALEIRPVTLASGKISDFYLDCKKVTLHGRGLFLASTLLLALLDQEDTFPDAVGGPTLGADPLVAGLLVLAQMRNQTLRGLIVRKEPKKYGTSQWVEGIENLQQKANVVVIEDVVTTGGSSVRAIERVRAHGFHVSKLLCLVDREEGGHETLQNHGVTLTALFRAGELKRR